MRNGNVLLNLLCFAKANKYNPSDKYVEIAIVFQLGPTSHLPLHGSLYPGGVRGDRRHRGPVRHPRGRQEVSCTTIYTAHGNNMGVH